MDVLMPQLGETVAEGKIVKWFKAAGDAVKPGDNLFEIETDKISMEVPATSAGTLTDIRFEVGEVAQGRRRGGGDRRRRRACQGAPALRQLRPQLRTARAASGRCRAGARRRPRPSRAPTPLDPFHEVRTPERNFGPAKTGRRHLHHAAGAPARRRARHRPVARCAAPARMAASSRATSRARRAGAAPRWRPAPAPRRSRRCSRASPTRKCRSTACARPSPSAWSRPSRPSRISI